MLSFPISLPIFLVLLGFFVSSSLGLSKQLQDSLLAWEQQCSHVDVDCTSEVNFCGALKKDEVCNVFWMLKLGIASPLSYDCLLKTENLDMIQLLYDLDWISPASSIGGGLMRHNVEKENMSAVLKLLELVPTWVNVQCPSGLLPLQYASTVEMFSLLIDHGADLERKSNGDKNVFQHIVSKNMTFFEKVSSFLENRGVVSRKEIVKKYLDPLPNDIALKAELIRLFLSYGMSPDVKVMMPTNTLMMTAVKEENFDVVEMLFKVCSKFKTFVATLTCFLPLKKGR